MKPSELLQIKVNILEIAAKLTNYNSYNDAVKKYNDLCNLVGLNNYPLTQSEISA
jgi:hypothetical protein